MRGRSISSLLSTHFSDEQLLCCALCTFIVSLSVPAMVTTLYRYLDASCFLLACVTGRIALFPTARSEHDVPFTELFDTKEWDFLLRDHKWQQLSAEEGPAANHVTFDFNAWFCSDLLAKL